jgi:S1-C subfamily serine protease
LARTARLPANYKGVIVGTIQSGSPAEKAGLKGLTQDDSGATKIGDIITAVDGHATRQIDDIINYIESQKNVGDNIKLTVNRDGQIMDLTATLQARPQTSSLSSSQNQDQLQPPGLGPIPELPQIPGFSLPPLPPLVP